MNRVPRDSEILSMCTEFMLKPNIGSIETLKMMKNSSTVPVKKHAVITKRMDSEKIEFNI